ncbi:MAG: hypothetical protein IAF02_05980 [Anaerolineae bacterium]|nr:hypothetical protein [Anaerolineae bacterium]
MSNNSGEVKVGSFGWFTKYWKRLPTDFRWHIEDSFQPEDIAERLLPNEEPVLQIGLAWYRAFPSSIIFRYFGVFVILTIVSTVIMLILAFFGVFGFIFTTIPVLIFIAIVASSIQQYVTYSQWRVLRTNKRLIISLPQPHGFPLVDNIELKGVPTVVDTNWSRNPVWRFFQFFTGARDMYISMVAYKFNESTARVGDALIIPDVTLRDVLEFKKVVFG